jgi:hypothetical protein
MVVMDHHRGSIKGRIPLIGSQSSGGVVRPAREPHKRAPMTGRGNILQRARYDTEPRPRMRHYGSAMVNNESQTCSNMAKPNDGIIVRLPIIPRGSRHQHGRF